MNDHYYLAITRLKLKSTRYIVPFFIHNERVVKQIRASEGFLKGKQLATPSLSMWTATLWTCEEALKTFYLSGEHRAVMSKISEWSSEAVSGHQQVDSNKLPSWDYVRTQLHQIGRFTHLQEHSFDYLNKIILKPYSFN